MSANPIEVKVEEEETATEIADPENWFYVQWGMESVKRNLQSLNDVLGRMVVLVSSLFGGSVFFIKDDLMNRGAKLIVLGALAASLTASVAGLIPYSGMIELDNPEAIRTYKSAAISCKKLALSAAFVFLVIAFFVAIGAIAFCQPPPK